MTPRHGVRCGDGLSLPSKTHLSCRGRRSGPTSHGHPCRAVPPGPFAAMSISTATPTAGEFHSSYPGACAVIHGKRLLSPTRHLDRSSAPGWKTASSRHEVSYSVAWSTRGSRGCRGHEPFEHRRRGAGLRGIGPALCLSIVSNRNPRSSPERPLRLRDMGDSPFQGPIRCATGTTWS